MPPTLRSRSSGSETDRSHVDLGGEVATSCGPAVAEGLRDRGGSAMPPSIRTAAPRRRAPRVLRLPEERSSRTATFVAARLQRVDDMRSDEPGAAGDKCPHPGGSLDEPSHGPQYRGVKPSLDPDPIAALRAALEAVAAGLDGAAVERATLERPPKPELGDYSTNAAMLVRRPRSVPHPARSPSGCASRLAERPRFERRADRGRRARDSSTYSSPIAGIGTAPSTCSGASGRPGARERVLVEFVSANPTGPVTWRAAGARPTATPWPACSPTPATR